MSTRRVTSTSQGGSMRALKVRGQVTTNRGGVAASSAGSAVSLRRRTRERRVRARTDLRGQCGRGGGTTGGARTGSNWSRPRRDSEHGRCDNLPVAFPSHQAITAGARPTPSRHQKPSLPREPILRFFFQITGNRVHAAASSELAISGRERIAVRRTPITPGASLPA